ncbi:signal peptidase I [Kangiella sediminilitoris]|uniref:Signal peptidase I n=1 Tax=Kangiella sediminilitoris TaxID=1144748 RepID=A0A1B3BC63_9GAMM|nr:signal peptidase I [Kangiella sediminilitoris]AOE50399.1 Signal peptidase I [Kangiella sediminilitoris]
MPSIYYDFGFYLGVAALITGVVTLLDKIWWQKKRAEAGKIQLDEKGEEKFPPFIDICRSFFPIIFVVLVLRSFLYEPYRIPSGSMNPGLYDGDFILVNKFAYGIRLPAFNTKIIDVGEPQRGDVIVFHPPHEPQQAYIKRLIGIPGDRLEWDRGTLTIIPQCRNAVNVDGQSCDPITIKSEFVSDKVEDLVPAGNNYDTYSETINGESHDLIYLEDNAKPRRYHSLRERWTEVVPEGKYFAMGDNRDGSLDSRFWRFIDEEGIIGKAAYKWIFVSFTEDPVLFGKHLPKGISFSRAGAIE